MSIEEEKRELHVVVHYPAAAEPYRTRAPRMETVGQLKAAVLNAFGLKEGSQPDGSDATYTLHFEKRKLEDMSETLGSLAGGSDELKLKLSQHITQGAA